MDPPGRLRAQCSEPNPGSLVLSPAPGEQFDLSIQLADQLLNFVSDTVYMLVEGRREGEAEALMQLNGLQYGIGDRYVGVCGEWGGGKRTWGGEKMECGRKGRRGSVEGR